MGLLARLWVFSLPHSLIMVMPGKAVGTLSGGVIATARTPNQGVPGLARGLHYEVPKLEKANHLDIYARQKLPLGSTQSPATQVTHARRESAQF